MTNVNFYSVQLVKEKGARYDIDNNISSNKNAAQTIETIFNLSSKPEEHLVLLTLNTKNKITGAFTVHIGAIDTSIVSPASIFQRALLSNASHILIAHNHPSGNPVPSPQDISVTKRISEAGLLLGVKLLDHIIIGENGIHYSLRENNSHIFVA